MQMFVRHLVSLGILCAILFGGTRAFADVKHEGAWEKDKTVSFDASGMSRRDAIKKLADAAGWSVVASGVGEGAVDVHVKDQSAAAVLDLLLDDADYVATRKGDLVNVKPSKAAAAPADAPVANAQPTAPAVAAVPPVPPPPATDAVGDQPPAPPPVPSPPGSVVKKNDRGDRTIFGSNVRIEANETVGDVTVFGGNVDVYGHVTRDLTVFGGAVTLHDGAHVDGDATAVGGNLKLEAGSSVERDVSVVGGSIDRDVRAHVGGSMDQQADKSIGLHFNKEHDAPVEESFLRRVGSHMTSIAILFVFGTIFLALASGRMEAVRVEVAARPMRAFALGFVSFLAGCVAFVVLCVTLIGIPVAVVGAILAVIAGYAGVAAALTTFGAAVLQHRTTSPYVHLAFGCAVFFVVSLIPVIGGITLMFLIAVGLGALVATRGAGFFVRKRDMGPYRTAV